VRAGSFVYRRTTGHRLRGLLSPPASSGARHRRRSTSQLVRDQLAGDKAEFPLAFLISTTRLGAAPIHAVAWNGRDTQLILVSRGASSRRIVSNHFSLVLALLSFESVTSRSKVLLSAYS
jgi:hypothetical protein